MQSGFQELLDEFLLEARERADEVESMLLRLTSNDEEVRDASIARVKRELHTLKGNSGMMGFSDLQELAHRMEDEVEELDLDQPEIGELLADLDNLRHGLDRARSSASDPAEPAAAAGGADKASQRIEDDDEASDGIGGSVRVPFSQIDQLVEMQAETLIFRNRLSDAVKKGVALLNRTGDDDKDLGRRFADAWEDVEIAQQMLEKVLHQLQDQVTNLGMVPLRSLFRSLRRVIHDESGNEGKQVELVIEGGDTPIDKTLLEAASEALGHLVRNAVIHGIEQPAERLRQGKSESGTVRLRANVEGGEIRIDVSDDGAGVDVAALDERARQLMGDDYQPGSDLSLLFAEGLSTHQGTDLSAGRGVGLSAVKKSVEQHGGRVEIRTQRGLGTSFSLRLPVTASILRSLLLRVDTEDYALPLSAVVESTRLTAQDRHQVNQAQVMRWRDKLIPILDLGLTFGTARAPRSEGFVIVIEISGRFRGLAIDALVGIRDIVVKGLDSIVGQPRGISGLDGPWRWPSDHDPRPGFARRDASLRRNSQMTRKTRSKPGGDDVAKRGSDSLPAPGTPSAETPSPGKTAAPATKQPAKVTLPAFGFAADLLPKPAAEPAAVEPAAVEPVAENASPKIDAADPRRIFAFADGLERSAIAEPEAAPVRLETWVAFSLAGEVFALPVAPIREVVRVASITRVPHAPKPIRGVTNRRGRVIPVIDLRLRIELPPTELGRSSRVIVVSSRRRLLGLLVDAVHQVIHIDLEQVQPPPDDVMTVQSDYLTGVYHLDDQLILLLDIDRALIIQDTAHEAGGEAAGEPEAAVDSPAGPA